MTKTTDTSFSLQVNGRTQAFEVDNRLALLDVLREHLALTGTKKGCDHGQCGACTVLVDGRRVKLLHGVHTIDQATKES